MKYIYTQDELKQRSDEWVELRGTKIGASEIPAIIGQNRFEKASTVWKRKTGRLKPKAMNAAMLRGVDMEDEAVSNLMNYLESEGIEEPKVEPFVCIHPKYDDIAVSFDGVDLKNKYIIEVKCPTTSWNFKSVFTDGIPDHYYPQVQLQLFMANEHWGITKAYFGSYFPDGAYVTDYIAFVDRLKTIAVIDEDYNEEYCQSMLKVIELFVHNVKYDTWDKEEYEERVNIFRKEVGII